MGISSIKSIFQLETYKMDNIKFSVDQSLNVLAQGSGIFLNENDFSLALRNPFRFKDDKKTFYVSGVRITLKLRNKKEEEIANGSFEISGLFSAKGFKDLQIEEKLAKYQAPTILLPYIRACITSVLANAGFGSIILPLINMNIVANSMDLKIEDKGAATK